MSDELLLEPSSPNEGEKGSTSELGEPRRQSLIISPVLTVMTMTVPIIVMTMTVHIIVMTMTMPATVVTAIIRIIVLVSASASATASTPVVASTGATLITVALSSIITLR
jgi:hypothetical protein